LEDDAAAHPKYRESLPLEKKVQILEDKVKAQKYVLPTEQELIPEY
jgi:hypothetical protein